MRLLVSVKNVEEATAALAGGADFIDAKDPAAGALGAVSLDVLRGIHSTVAGLKPVSAALGDAVDEQSIERDVRAYALAGASLVKIGFAGISSRSRVDALLNAARRGAAQHAGVIAVAYADAERVASPHPDVILDAAANMSVAGVLLDTADKRDRASLSTCLWSDWRRGSRLPIERDFSSRLRVSFPPMTSRSPGRQAQTSPACAVRRATMAEPAGSSPTRFDCFAAA